MNNKIETLKNKAEMARIEYMKGNLNRDEAKAEIMPYIEAVNAKAVELAKKYNMKAKKITFRYFLR